MAKNNAKAEDVNTNVDDDLESVIEYSESIENAERPAPLPVGQYLATITDVKKKTGKESGRPYAEVRFSISKDAMPADYVEVMGDRDSKTVVGRFFFLEDNPQSRWNARRFCEAIGAPMANRLDMNDWKGLECKLDIEHQADLEGNPAETVRRVVSN